MNQTIREHTYPSGQKLQLAQGDITAEQVDAIVNAANEHLMHGAGVAGAIVRKGGPVIQQESDHWVRQHGPVSHAAPAYTSAGSLTCRYVIHAVGPIWGDGDEDKKLSSAIQGSLRVAEQLGLSSIAFPALSTGVFGFPKLHAAQVILSSIDEYLVGKPESSVNLVRIVLFDQDTLQAFLSTWEQDDHLRA